MKNIPIVTFALRNWMLLLVFCFSDWLAMTEVHFRWLGKWVVDPELGGLWRAQTPMECFGPILWVVSFGIAAYLMTLLQIHLHYRETIDADTWSGKYKADWAQCTPFERVKIATYVRIGVFVGLCLLYQNLARGETPKIDQAARWDAATVAPQKRMALDVELALYRRTLPRYQAISNMRHPGVPPEILFCLHYRESDNDFTRHAHEGSSLQHRTRDEPKGRPLTPDPPYTFEQSAYDAYYVYERPTLDKIDWRDGQKSLDKMESFNGYGYRKLGVASPYLWSGTSIYHGGKYVSDGKFSRTAMDAQLGCCAILKWFEAHGIALSFVE